MRLVKTSMKKHMSLKNVAALAFGVACIASMRLLAGAQSLTYTKGQNIAPAYEGWEQDADGSKYYDFEPSPHGSMMLPLNWCATASANMVAVPILATMMPSPRASNLGAVVIVIFVPTVNRYMPSIVGYPAPVSA